VEYFLSAKKKIGEFLAAYLEEKAREFSFIPDWGRDAVGRLAAFGLEGKMVRGGLVLLGHEMRGGGRHHDALRCAAAMELAQAGFLIHDDIMDRDETRRGEPSLFKQYADLAAARGFADPYHQGESLGICGGDLAFFLALDLLSVDDPPPGYLGFCSRELAAVCLAQMQDVAYGAGDEVPGEAEILALYAHKTGRYSFSLPLTAGAMLAGAKAAELSGLSALGERMGVLFQIRDDELGIFGQAGELGKPIGSDIREGKKTIFYRALLDSLPPGKRERARSLFGRADSGQAELEEARDLIEGSGARARVAGIAARLSAEALEILTGLEIDPGRKETLKSLVRFANERKK
jgi:geranylgeranyl diphosphate synthase type I